MKLELPAGLFDALLARQHLRGTSGSPAKELGAVWLHTDMGPSFYLTRDGRILGDDFLMNEPLHEIDEPEAFSVLVAASKTIAAPELLLLLPERPASASVCPRCGGARRAEIASVPEGGESNPIVCWDCYGLGWTQACGRGLEELRASAPQAPDLAWSALRAT